MIILLSSSIIYCFASPKAKYTSQINLTSIQVPYTITDWQGKDVAKELNLEDERYNFVSEVLARVYANPYGESLLLLILDAGNFHHPKVCFGSSGFKIKELNDTEFHISNRILKAHTLYASKGNEGFIVVYWICIDKKIVDWTEQKIKQLWFSLFNKQKSGLMIRLDIPTREDRIEDSLKLARTFMADLTETIPPKQADYIFGR
jgi:EpsI family protein